MANGSSVIKIDVLGSDEYLSLSLAAQAVYPQALIAADALGCIDRKRQVTEGDPEKEAALEELISYGFVIRLEAPYDSTLAITHWWAMNGYKDDRFGTTRHGMLIEKELRFYSKTDRRYMRPGSVSPDFEGIRVSEVIRRLSSGETASGAEAGRRRDGGGTETPLNTRQGNVTQIATQGNTTETAPSPSSDDNGFIAQAIAAFNEEAGADVRGVDNKTAAGIMAIRESGRSIDDVRAVVRSKFGEWQDSEKMKRFIRPSTLFGDKFEEYLATARSAEGVGDFAAYD